MKRLALALLITAAPAAIAQSAPDARGEKPAAMAGFSEYNMPKDLYIPGDPLLISEENMNRGGGKRIAFIACPILEDGQPTPLWTTRYNGETYFLRAQQNMTGLVHHPQLRHQVLVEGVISDEPRIAGGIVLNPLNLSPLRELDATCVEKLPDQGHAISFAKRPPGPGSSGGDRESKNTTRRDLRARLDAEHYTPDPVAERVKRDFTVRFNFDNDTVWYFATVAQAVKYARDVNASKIEIKSYRGSVLLSDGRTVNEWDGVEKSRAQRVYDIITDYHIDPKTVSMDSVSEPARPDGLTDFANRRVVITVTPGPEQQRDQVASAGASAPTR